MIKNFIKKYWKLGLIILICVVIGGIIALIFELTGATDIATLRVILEGVGWRKYIVFILIHISCDLLLSFFPFTSMSLILIGAIMFPWWINFIINAICVMCVSFLLYALGRKFGFKIGNKLVGEDEMNKAKNFFNTRGIVYLPVMFLFPFFPDDALCLVAGASKMKSWYFAICTCTCRIIGILTWCLVWLFFGQINVLDIFTTLINTLGVLTGSVIIICIILTLLMTIYFIIKIVKNLANKVDSYFLKKKEQAKLEEVEK